MIVLQEIQVNPMLRQFLLVVSLRKETAVITILVRPNQFYIRDLSRDNFHRCKLFLLSDHRVPGLTSGDSSFPEAVEFRFRWFSPWVERFGRSTWAGTHHADSGSLRGSMCCQIVGTKERVECPCVGPPSVQNAVI